QLGRDTPVVGELGLASPRLGIRPARYALRPASTPSLIASAIRAGSLANATAVLTRTASAPTSIARAASEGTPMPASTTTGTRDPDGFVGGAAARGVGQDAVARPVDRVEEGFLLGVVEIEAAQGNGDELAAGGLEGGQHRLVARVFAGAQEQARAQRDAGDDQGVRVGQRLHRSNFTGRPRGAPTPRPSGPPVSLFTRG